MTETDEMMNVTLAAIILVVLTGTLMFISYVDYYKSTEKNIPFASKSQINEIAIFKTSLVGYPFGYLEEFTIKLNHELQEACKTETQSKKQGEK